MFITGETGTGKSTLVNGLLGAEVARENCTCYVETTEVISYEKEFENKSVKVTLWESCGLQYYYGTRNEAQCLADLKKKCSDMDICIYCVNMTRTRTFIKDINVIKRLTKVFGKKLWENSVFALTFANIAGETDLDILEADYQQKPDYSCYSHQ